MTHPQRLGLTVADSTPQIPPTAGPPRGAPNIVAIVLDDTGFAQLGCFGSDIATPNVDRLAASGLRYNRFHVTSLCSPTRASFLTGRNHHAVGMGFLADIPLAYPGYTARRPLSAATLPRILRDAGYSTLAVGKWHLTPRFERSAAGPFDRWPLGWGFERYYGFLQGDANHWAPNLVSDNHYVDPPARHEDGYHLSEDLAETAIRFVLDQQQAAPGKPFFLYFALGAMHAPHHVAPEWVEPYRGKFDHGWDAWREEIFARQLTSGIVPPGTVLTPRPEWVDAWNALGEPERRMHARQQEVFAGFLTHTDAQIGRVVDALTRFGLLDDTVILLFSDNGASAEGGRTGSVNEHRFTARIPESAEDNLAAIDEWGGPRTYNHYSWAWAWAGNTPLRLWKRYTWLGGTRTPLVVHWPRGIAARGETRSQFAHVIDLMPTVLDVVGLTAPLTVDGVTQQRIDGASLRPTFDDGNAPDPRVTQYFEMLGSRSIFHDGWKATTDHISTGVLDEERMAVGSRSFDDDHWGLFDLRHDFSESTDVANEHPELVKRLIELWMAEAGSNQVLPVDDSLANRLGALIPPLWPPGVDRTFVPGGGPVSDESVPMLFGGFRITADVDSPGDEAAGILCALGDLHGGFALFVDHGRLVFTFSRAGDRLEVVADTAIPSGRVALAVTYAPGRAPQRVGTFHLYHGDTQVGSIDVPGMLPIAIQHGGAGLRLGFDSGLPVSDRYTPPFPWNGMLRSVRFQTAGARPDPNEEIRAALHSD
ncbi:MAG: arylsulfatase [Actinomycetota bacterium]|jgi:arylsulfatase|nr:arylsulfatase [Actinomycetota bacterium]